MVVGTLTSLIFRRDNVELLLAAQKMSSGGDGEAPFWMDWEEIYGVEEVMRE